MSRADRPTIVLGKGPRACEKALLDNVERQLQGLELEVLSRPISLLVPSHSLRNHILERLVKSGRGVAGLRCFTLRGLAREILERRGESPLPGSWMLPILVRRAAREQPALRSCLDHLHDGYGSLVGAVTDLLEAGLDPAHSQALDEVTAEEGRLVTSVAEVQRARSLIQIATQVQEWMASLGLGHVSSLLQRATELLRSEPSLQFPCSGFHVYGFADATGVATDLIEAVLLRFGGIVYLDHPPDPAQPNREDVSFEFSRRFAQRLSDLGKPDPEPVATESSNIELIAALGGQAEVRETGWRIRRLIDDGVEPEKIGVVARRLEGYRTGLRTHFGRLGIPYSAIGISGPLLPRGRRLRALTEVLSRRERARLDRWLDTGSVSQSSVPDFDLRLAMFGLGVGRIGEMAQLDPGRVLRGDTYPLPVRLGFTTEDEDPDIRLPRRHVPTELLRRVCGQARELCDLFERWQDVQTFSGHVENLDQLLAQLGWSASDPSHTDVQSCLSRISAGVPGSMELRFDEFTQVLTDSLAASGSEPFGGQGGGVQILDVTEARGRTFDQLFVLGMNKGSFPRTIREDPALPDSLRQVLGREGHGVLPDLPVKRAGFAEERYLFAQLCSSSPHVTLSWQVADDNNREVTTSPLVERLLWTRTPDRVASPQTAEPLAGTDERLRTPYENAVRAALMGTSRQIKAVLAAAHPNDLSVPTRDLAEARWSVVTELDRSPGDGSRLGPYLGFIGATRDHWDPRQADNLYVTTLERFSACPWRTFLERLLRLEALPDPVEVLPGLDPILTGQLVHRVLERLVDDHLQSQPTTLEEARAALPVDAPWPSSDDLLRLVEREASAVALAQGITWAGFSEVLAQVALPHIEQARGILWQDPEENRPVAVEMEGSLPIGSGTSKRRLHFKADRVDNLSGRLRLSDYKTSRRSISDAKKTDTRHRHLIQQIGQGRLLQAAAYARAGGEAEDKGNYLFVHPDLADRQDIRIVTVGACDEQAQSAYDEATATLVSAWDAGIFFPRLVEPDSDKEPRACDYCAVAEACVRGDSAARGRLRDWSARRRPTMAAETAFLDLWTLGSDKEPRR